MSSFRASCGQVAGKSFQNLISLLQLLCGIEVNELDVQLKGRAKQEICWLDIEVGHQHALAWSNSGRAFALPELLHAKAGRCSMVSDDTEYLDHVRMLDPFQQHCLCMQRLPVFAGT